MKLCPGCGDSIETVETNLSVTRAGVEVRIIGLKASGCPSCQTVYELPKHVEAQVDRLINENKMNPGSPSVITLNLME